MTPWLLQSEPQDAIASGMGSGLGEPGEPGEPAEPHEVSAPLETKEQQPLAIAPAPEQPYDPFADPFGAPPVHRREAPGSGPVANGGEDMAALEDATLAASLPPESWTLAPGTIVGRILGENGHSLTKARVCAWIVDPSAPLELRRRPRCAEVDRRGRFEIHDVAPSLYDISAFARGYEPQSLVSRDGYPLAVQPGERTGGVELALMAGGVEIRGTVKTRVGTPIASASVSVVGSARALAVTNASGELSLWVSEGEVAVVAWAEGYGDVVVRTRAGKPLALVLPLQGILVGRVLDSASGEPIAKARVRAGSQAGGIDPLVYTDDHGRFRITALPEGEYLPSAHTDDAHGEATHEVRIIEGTVSAEVSIEVETPVVVPPTGEAQAEATESNADEPDPHAEDEAHAEHESKSAGGKHDPYGPIRRKTKAKLLACLRDNDTDGSIVIARTHVYETGKLREVDVRVSGNAEQHPEVEACAIEVANAMRLPRSDGDFKMFKRLEASL